MVIFRPHRGSLNDAMEHKKEFKTIPDMIDYIYEDWDGWIRKEGIVVYDKDIHDDDRVGWKDVHYVCMKGIKDNDGSYKDYIKLYGVPQCIGMCSENYKIEKCKE